MALQWHASCLDMAADAIAHAATSAIFTRQPASICCYLEQTLSSRLMHEECSCSAIFHGKGGDYVDASLVDRHKTCSLQHQSAYPDKLARHVQWQGDLTSVGTAMAKSGCPAQENTCCSL